MAENTDFSVILSEAAIADMSELGRWIAERADIKIAETYVSRVEAACYRLATGLLHSPTEVHPGSTYRLAYGRSLSSAV